MHKASQLGSGEAKVVPEPIAIVGVSALYPDARGVDDYWKLLTETSLSCDCDIAANRETAPSSRCGRMPDAEDTADSGLDDVLVDVAGFGIPPAQAKSMARMQLLILEAARQCLADAGYIGERRPAARTDVVVGTSFGLDRQYANAARIEGSRYARELQRVASDGPYRMSTDALAEGTEELRTRLQERFGASPHDRVGEMASTIPARVASAFKLRGRTLAVESADASSFVALSHAMHCLHEDLSDAALVLAGQREEGGLLARALSAKGLSASGTHPFAADGQGFAIGSGIGAVLLKRLSTAVADQDRIYATIRDCSLGHDARPGVFRYSTSVERRYDVAAAAYRTAGVPLESVQYVECVGSGIVPETEAEIEALARLFDGGKARSVALGSVKDRLGHTFANAGLAGLSKVALALHHRTLPPQWSPEKAVELDVSGTPFRFARTAERWPEGPSGGPRRAAISGASLTGTLCHLLVEEYDPSGTPDDGTPATLQERASRAAAAAPPGSTAQPPVPEPIAIVSFGGYFADSPDADSFWETILSGRDRIGPLPEALLDRELYHAPGALSLMHSYTDLGSHVVVPQAPPSALRITPQRYAAMDGAQRVGLSVADELFTRWGATTDALRGRGIVVVGSNLGLSSERRASAHLVLPDIEAEAARLAALEHLSESELQDLLDRVRTAYGTSDEVDSPVFLDGSLASGTAALIANEYRLGAVPMAVEAACASSLAALDLAVNQLRRGSADYAIAGGVELPCNARDMVLCSSLGLLSHNKITPFGPDADGFTPGDGCALFLLKRYRDAVRDGDTIHGLLRGVGASNDAKSLIAPDTDGQVRAMQQAFDQVDFTPAEVDYLEAHGTGTRVGDRVEISAVARVYAGEQRDRPLEIGSVKSYFGHTFAAAGGAGLLRALQAVRSQTLPPTANVAQISPQLDLGSIPAAVSTQATPWQTEDGRPRRAGVSSFGTGGINYHVLLEEHLGDTP